MIIRLRLSKFIAYIIISTIITSLMRALLADVLTDIITAYTITSAMCVLSGFLSAVLAEEA